MIGWVPTSGVWKCSLKGHTVTVTREDVAEYDRTVTVIGRDRNIMHLLHYIGPDTVRAYFDAVVPPSSDTTDPDELAFIECADGHDGPGWYCYSQEYPDDGSTGAFANEQAARDHAAMAGAEVQPLPDTTDHATAEANLVKSLHAVIAAQQFALRKSAHELRQARLALIAAKVQP